MTRAIRFFIVSRTVRWMVGIAFVVLMIAQTWSDNAVLSGIVVALAACVIALPAVAAILLWACFAVHNWIVNGNPFVDEKEPFVKVVQEVHVKKQKAWCVLCKQFTGCRVRKNPYTGLVIHVIR